MANLQLTGSTAEPQADPLDDLLSLTPAKAATPMGEILVNGELIPRDDVDALRDGLRWIEKARAPHKQAMHMLDYMESQIRQAVRELASGPNKTQRLVGQNGGALKVELPSDGWHDDKLIQAFERFPEFRHNCLKINKVGVKLVEWKKLLTITDPPPGLAEFIAAVKAAVKPATALPTVTIEGEKNVIDVKANEE